MYISNIFIIKISAKCKKYLRAEDSVPTYIHIPQNVYLILYCKLFTENNIKMWA